MTRDDPALRGERSARDTVASLTASLEHQSPLVRRAAAWRSDERHEVVAGLDRVVDGLTALRAAILVAEREADTWRGAGDRSF